MYLKKIEMQGFKSFADKTIIEFDKGVTAVVGPNGSGKSNITESLRWAFGESSAKNLRGGKMPDVIFAGTENRQPLNYAQVIVTLDNSDHFIKEAKDIIRIERHIYRNGDNDYLIDGRKVRLRDIHNLFMDTGLGRDSFSVISQGRVETIFNSKPEERRVIFEEAAGVLKYKTRKKETQAKLEKTQDNLERLDDIIHELTLQIKPLENQAKIAREFIDLEENRKQLQLDILVEDIQNYKKKLTTSTQSLEEIKQSLSIYYDNRKQYEHQNQKLKEKRHKLSDDISKKQEELLKITTAISNLERQMALVSLETSQKEEKVQATKEQLANLKKQQTQITEELSEKKNRLTQLDNQLAKVSIDIQTVQEDLERFSVAPDQVIEKLREEFVVLMQKEAELSNKRTVIMADIENQKQLSQSKSEELIQTQNTLTELNILSQKASEKFHSAHKKVEELQNDYRSLQLQFVQNEKDYHMEQTKMFEHLDLIKSKEARKVSLESIIKNHSQFYAGVKYILQASSSGQVSGVIGAVSEHLSFEKSYQTALEIALGSSSQHIIVEDERVAKHLITFLKKNRQGRATFLPLTTIKSRHLSQQHYSTLRSSQGFLGVASELVSFDNRLEVIFQNLLGTTAVFDTVDNANQAARFLRYQVRIVTLDGTEIRPSGSFSGGANRQNNTIFIKPELNHLISELNVLKEKQSEQEKQVKERQEVLKSNQERLVLLKEKGEKARLEEQKSELEYQQLSERLSDVNNIYSHLKGVEMGNELHHLENQKEELDSELVAITHQKQTLTHDIEQIKENHHAMTQKGDALRQKLSHLKLTERDLINERKFELANQKRLCLHLDETKSEWLKYKELLDSHHTKARKADSFSKLQKQHDDAIMRKSSEEEELVKLRLELENCEADLEKLGDRLLKEQQKNEKWMRKQGQIESEMSRFSEYLRQFSHQLTEEYHFSLEEAQKLKQPIANIESSRQQLQELHRRIKALGPVNLEAISQYDDVNERLTFLHHQKEDLEHSKNLLHSAMTDMDEEVKKRFKMTFNAIRDSFHQTFTQMFGGGSADLSLTEKEKWLTSGIHISVQPPGKKIQSLNLMSGGEKALSALALLFAIIRVKTIPFVVLDEVEAALDEANVKRFGDYLNRFDKSSQFIVVTHRKGTMAAADSIYGVTMQESGISRIISVKLKEAETFAT